MYFNACVEKFLIIVSRVVYEYQIESTSLSCHFLEPAFFAGRKSRLCSSPTVVAMALPTPALPFLR